VEIGLIEQNVHILRRVQMASIMKLGYYAIAGIERLIQRQWFISPNEKDKDWHLTTRYWFITSFWYLTVKELTL